MFVLGYNEYYKTDAKIAKCVVPSAINVPADTVPFLRRWAEICHASAILVIPGKVEFDPVARQAFLDGSSALVAEEASRSPIEPGLQSKMQRRAFEVFCQNGFLQRVVDLASKRATVVVTQIPPGMLAVFACQDRHQDDIQELKKCLSDAGRQYFPVRPN